jgi:hypothetical protein
MKRMPFTPDRIARIHGNGKIAAVPHGLRHKFFGLSIGSLPGTWLRDKELVRSHHLSGKKDSGYTANSIATSLMIRFACWKSTLGLRRVPELKSALVRDGVRLRLGFHGLLGGYDAAVNLK